MFSLVKASLGDGAAAVYRPLGLVDHGDSVPGDYTSKRSDSRTITLARICFSLSCPRPLRYNRRLHGCRRGADPGATRPPLLLTCQSEERWLW